MGNTHLYLRDYVRLHATIHCEPKRQDNLMNDPLVTTILAQYHISKGIKVFGETVMEDILKELNQLNDRMVMDPKNADEMPATEILRIHDTLKYILKAFAFPKTTTEDYLQQAIGDIISIM